MTTSRSLAALLGVVLALPWNASAEEPEPDDRGRYARIRTDSARSPARLLETPLAISVLSAEEVRGDRPAVDLAESLSLVPGILAQSSRNFAQDTRISIRGFGARAPFGVRGVKILVDGIPTTLPDGQSELDSIDLAFADRIEVVRGPISSLYGGGGGGILSVSTLDPTDEPHVTLRTVFGTDHLSRHEATGTGRVGGLGYTVGLARTRTSGYREHARAEQTTLFTKFEHALPDGSLLGVQVSNVWAPEAQDPGGLKQTEVDADRGAARARAFSFDTGERLDQQRVGLSLNKPLAPGRELRMMGYYVGREFRNSLPFTDGGRVVFDRTAGGGSIVFDDRSGRFDILAGLDVDLQRDHRRRFDNANGAYGPLVINQIENVRALGGFAQIEADLGHGFGATLGGRYDRTEFVASPRGPSAAATTRFRLREVSPRFGVHYRPSRHFTAYANVSGAFRVPTTTELGLSDANGPLPGFNSDLEPERTRGAELGVKGVFGERVLYDVAIFDLRIRDAIIPFQDTSGRELARNAGEARRRGIEVGLSASLHPWLNVRTAWTWMRSRYRDFDVLDGSSITAQYDGNDEPGIPDHALAAELRFAHPSGWFATLALRHTSDVETNDANTAESQGAWTTDVRAGREWSHRGWQLRPFVGARNWTGAKVDGTVRLNDERQRFYEPAPWVELYAGIRISH